MSKSKKSKATISELRGLSSLLTDATTGVTESAQDLHKRILMPSFLPDTPIRKLIALITDLVYSGVKGVTRLVGKGVDKSWEQINPKLRINLPFKEKEQLIAILNGIVGDYLVENSNPLATEMEVFYQGKALDLGDTSDLNFDPIVNGKILLMVHGLCMDYGCWTRKEHNHGELIAAELGSTPLYLNYNSGLHISANGKKLNSLLEKIIESWPVPIQEITILAHSMGGLLMRSAMHYATEEENNWQNLLEKIVFIGTPHHGSPVERIGNYTHHLLNSIHYTKPFGKLARLRSAGISDLRHGNLRDEDWEHADRFKHHKDQRLQSNNQKVENFYCIAASLAKDGDELTSSKAGDGLVLPKSAFGENDDSKKDLGILDSNKSHFSATGHFDLLSSKEVYRQIRLWLTANS